MKKKHRRIFSTDHVPEIDGSEKGNRQGGEGNAFQVNDPPQAPVDRSPNQGHGAEGNAFQVNDQPAEKEKP